jgi:hypothetical protein
MSAPNGPEHPDVGGAAVPVEGAAEPPPLPPILEKISRALEGGPWVVTEPMPVDNPVRLTFRQGAIERVRAALREVIPQDNAPSWADALHKEVWGE